MTHVLQRCSRPQQYDSIKKLFALELGENQAITSAAVVVYYTVVYVYSTTW